MDLRRPCFNEETVSPSLLSLSKSEALLLENEFVAAQIFESRFDILEYLHYLCTRRMDNVTYSVLKKHLRGKPLDFIARATAPRYAQFTNIALAVLRGEAFRINGFALGDDTRLSEYSLYGFVTSYTVYTENAASVLAEFLPRVPAALDILDTTHQPVKEALASLLPTALAAIIEHNVLKEAVLEADVSGLSTEQLSRIIRHLFHERRSAKVGNSREMALKALERVMGGISPDNMLALSVAHAHEPSIFTDLLAPTAYRIIHEMPSLLQSDVITQFCYVYFYYKYSSGPLKEALSVLGLPGAESAILEASACFARRHACRSDFTEFFSGEIASSSDDAVALARLLPCFIACIEHSAPIDLPKLFEYPERFLAIGLRAGSSPEGRLLYDFYTNLLNERTARDISMSLDRDLLALFLIRRRIWFSMDFLPYVHLMDSRYKLIFAEHSLDWAADNLEELRRIGLTPSIYRKLAGSAYADRLAPEDAAVCTTEYQLSAATSGAAVEVREPADSVDNAVHYSEFKTDAAVCEDGTGAPTDEAHFPTPLHVSPMHAVANSVLAAFKANLPFDDFVNPELTNEDYVYLISTLYEYTAGSKHLLKLSQLLTSTLPRRLYLNMRYGEIRLVVLEVMGLANAAKEELLSALVAGVSPEDIPRLISDFHEHPVLPGAIHRKYALSREAESRKNGADNEGPSYIATNSEKVKQIVPPKEFLAPEGDAVAVLGRLCEVAFGESKLHTCVALAALRHIYPAGQAPFSVDAFLGSPYDSTVSAALEFVAFGSRDAVLLELVISREALDPIAVKAASRIDVKCLNEKDRNRIYMLFYTDPFAYVSSGLDRLGYEPEPALLSELIVGLKDVYAPAQCRQVAQFLSQYELPECCVPAILAGLDAPNVLYREWALGRISGAGMTLPQFLKLASYIATEHDIRLLERALGIIRELFESGRDTSCFSEYIEKWLRKPALSRLARLVYPFSTFRDRSGYYAILNDCREEEELVLIRRFHRLAEP